MQLIRHIPTPPYDTWKTAFDADSENWGAAGLTMKQIWSGVDASTQVTVLFNVADRTLAQSWLDKEASFGRAASKP